MLRSATHKVARNATWKSRVTKHVGLPSVVSYVAGSIASLVLFNSNPSYAQVQNTDCPPNEQVIERIVIIEGKEIPEVYSKIPSDKNIADGIAALLSEIEEELTSIQEHTVPGADKVVSGIETELSALEALENSS